MKIVSKFVVFCCYRNLHSHINDPLNSGCKYSFFLPEVVIYFPEVVIFFPELVIFFLEVVFFSPEVVIFFLRAWQQVNRISVLHHKTRWHPVNRSSVLHHKPRTTEVPMSIQSYLYENIFRRFLNFFLKILNFFWKILEFLLITKIKHNYLGGKNDYLGEKNEN